MKFYLKRIDPIDVNEVDNVVELEYIYTVEKSCNNYLSLERTVSRDIDNMAAEFGIWLSKFYKYDEIILYYQNFRYTIREHELVQSLRMY